MQLRITFHLSRIARLLIYTIRFLTYTIGYYEIGSHIEVYIQSKNKKCKSFLPSFWPFRERAKFMRNPGRVYIQGGIDVFWEKKRGARIYLGRKKRGQRFFLGDKKGGRDFF